MAHFRAAARPLLSLLMIAICLIAFYGCAPGEAPKTRTEYQAVFLDNGQVFFGKLENATSKYALLNDVYYIQRNEDPTSKQVSNVLVKRGTELHAPDVMYINTNHILVVESVTPASKVAQLILEAKTKK